MPPSPAPVRRFMIWKIFRFLTTFYRIGRQKGLQNRKVDVRSNVLQNDEAQDQHAQQYYANLICRDQQGRSQACFLFQRVRRSRSLSFHFYKSIIYNKLY
jgi:hypothetical protein